MKFIEKNIHKKMKRFERIFNRSDLIIATMLLVFGFLALYISFILGNHRLEQVSYVLISSALLFFIIRNRFPQSIESLLERRTSKTAFLFAGTIFFILFAISIFIINQAPYYRPLSFLVIVSIMAGIVAAQIALTNNKRHYHLILFEIIILGILIRASVFFQFSSLIGGDPWVHYGSIESIITLGHVTDQVLGYYHFPMMHIFVTAIHNLTGLDIRNSMFFIGLCKFLSLTFIFYIVKEFFGYKMGMMSFLILSVATHHIQWGFMIIPQTFSLVLLSILIYLIFMQKRVESTYKKTIYSIFTMLFLTMSILTHTIASFATLVILFSIFIIDAFKIKILEISGFNLNKKAYISGTIIAFFFVFLIYYWMHSAGLMGYIVESLRWGFSHIYQAPSVSTVMESFTTTAMRMLPLYTFIFFALIGFLYTLKIKNLKTISLYGWLILLFVFTSVFLGFDAFLPARWFIFIQIGLIVPSTIAVMALSQISPKKVLAIFLIVTALSFIGLTNYGAGAQNVNPYTPYPTHGMKYSENVALITILGMSTDKTDIFIDLGYRFTGMGYHNNLNGPRFKDASDILYGKDNLTGIILIRENIINNPHFTSALGGGHFSITQLTPEVLERIEKNMKIYDSGTVTAYKGGII